MTKTESKTVSAAVKDILVSNPDGLREIIRVMMQEVLEAEMEQALGASKSERTSERLDVVIDYKTQDFEKILSGYDLVLNSQDPKTLEKSLAVLKPGGQLISISGPPHPAFARELGLNLFLKLVPRLLSRGVRKKAKRLDIRYSFLFMRAEGQQLAEIARLIESGVIRPSSTRWSNLRRPEMRWLMSKRVVRKGRSSSQ
ncbi:NADPH:quinone reductase-like Zn-dependent oxidoreductase [Rhizobium mongolense]